jgi:hypothetical protein
MGKLSPFKRRETSVIEGRDEKGNFLKGVKWSMIERLFQYLKEFGGVTSKDLFGDIRGMVDSAAGY